MLTLEVMKDKILAICELRPMRADVNGKLMASAVQLDAKQGGCLHGLCGRGDTEEAAVADLFDQMTSAEELIHGAHTEERRAFKWDGVRFVPCKELYE